MLKLRSMNAKEPSAKQILRDIFGITDGESRFTGVIDSLDACEFNMALENLKPKWGSLCPSFFDWFIKNEAELMLINHCICP